MYIVNCDCTDCGFDRWIGPCLLEADQSKLDKKFIDEMMKKEREKSIEDKKQTVLRQRRNSIVLVSIV